MFTTTQNHTIQPMVGYPWLRHTTGAYESRKITTNGDA
jgi:hypothetical protein